MNKQKQLLFSITKDDFIIQTFRAGGKGGQNQNKRDTGVRIIHPESGARGEARDERSQKANKKLAFKRLVESDRFKKWHKIKCSRINLKEGEIEKEVKKMMEIENLKIEVKDAETGKWVELE